MAFLCHVQRKNNDGGGIDRHSNDSQATCLLLTLCDICGVEGFSECLAVCTRCNERAEHIYCMQAFCDAVPPSWVCEGCKFAQLHLQNKTFIPSINHDRKAETSHEASSCISGQERGHIEESISLKGWLNIVPSLAEGSVPQVGTSNDIKDDNACCRPNSCKSNRQEVSRSLHHSIKGAASGKLPASQFREKEQIPSFLLPSRPKVFPRSKSVSTRSSHVGANKKAEQSTGQLKHMKGAQDPHSGREVRSSTLGPAHLGVENSNVQGFAGFHCRNDSHAAQGGIMEQPLAQGLLGNRPRMTCPPHPHPLPVSNEKKLQSQYLDPHKVRPLRPDEHVMQCTLSQMSNYAYAQNASTLDSIRPHVPAIPHIRKLWRGSFNVTSHDNSAKVYKGIQGHPSSKADSKVWEAASSLPRRLKMQELQRGLDNTWPECFSFFPPSSGSIDIFFFPVDMESHDCWYKQLADLMLSNDLILRAESDYLYLLIFHSQLLPEAEQLWAGRHYLWGIFQPKRNPLTQRATVMQSAQQDARDNTEVVDMDIDMVGGGDIQQLTSMNGEPPPLPPGSPPPEPPPPPPHSQEDTGVNLLPEGSLSASPPRPFKSQIDGMAELSTVTEDDLAVHALSKDDGTTAQVQDRLCDFLNAMVDSDSCLMNDDIGKGSKSSDGTAALVQDGLCAPNARADDDSCLINAALVQDRLCAPNARADDDSCLINDDIGKGTKPSDGTVALVQDGLCASPNARADDDSCLVNDDIGKGIKSSDGTVALVQDGLCASPNARADSDSCLLNDDIGKGLCNVTYVPDASVCQGVACLPLFPVEESHPPPDTTGVLADLVSQGGLFCDLNWQAMSLVQQLDRPWYIPHPALDNVISEESPGLPVINADLTLLFPQYRKHGNIWIKVESDLRPCFDKNVELTLCFR